MSVCCARSPRSTDSRRCASAGSAVRPRCQLPSATSAPGVPLPAGRPPPSSAAGEPATAAALASLDEESELERRRADNRRQRARLAVGLGGLGLEPLPSEANFLAVGA